MPSQPFPPPAAALLDGTPQLRQALAQVVELAGQIERGQAAMPLRDHFEALRLALDRDPFTIVVVGLDAGSRAAARDWFCRSAAPVPPHNGSTGTPGLAVVHLHAATEGLRGMRLLLPESSQALAQSPALVARLRTEAHLIAVAGPAELDLDIEETATLRELVADALATWVMTCGTPPTPLAPTQGAPDRGWRAVLAGGTIPTLHLGIVLPALVPAVLAEAGSGVRGGLLCCQQARRFEAALDMLEDRVQQDVRQQTSRRQALSRRWAALGDSLNDRVPRETSEGLRGEIVQRVAGLNRDVEEQQRERLLPGAVSDNSIKNFLEDVSAADLAKERTGRVVHLAVGTECLTRAEQLPHELSQTALREDLARLLPELKSLTGDVSARLTAIDGRNRPASQDLFDESSLWESIRKAIHLKSRYSGEIVEIGGMEAVFEWAMHGRRPLLLLAIFSSMGVPFLTELRDRLAPVMIVIFVAGLVWARRSFREAQREKVAREVIRLRDALESEIRGLYEKTLRDWQARSAQQLREIEKELLREVDERVKAWVAATGSRSAAQRVELQTKLKVVDHRLRELEALVNQVGRIRQSAAGIRQTLEHETRNAISSLEQAARIT